MIPALWLLYSRPERLPSILYAEPAENLRLTSGDPKVADIIVVVLGTGGILLMAGYAMLCDRI